MDLARDPPQAAASPMAESEQEHLATMALIKNLECPAAIQTEEEAKALLESTQRLEEICKKKKEEIEKRLKQVYLDLKQADLHLFKVEVQIGRVQYLISKAGFSLPPPHIDRPKPDVIVDGTFRSIQMGDIGSMGIDLD